MKRPSFEISSKSESLTFKFVPDGWTDDHVVLLFMLLRSRLLLLLQNTERIWITDYVDICFLDCWTFYVLYSDTVGIRNWGAIRFWMVQRRLVWKWSDFQRDLKSGSQTTWNSERWLPFCQLPFKIWRKTARFWMVGVQMVGTIALARPFNNLKSDLQRVCISWW